MIMDDLQEFARPLSVFEKLVADQYARQGFKDGTDAYHVIRPEIKRETANSRSCVLLNRPHVREYLETLMPPVLPEEIKSVKKQFLKKVVRITEKAETSGEYSAALKGCELEAKVEGLFSQDDNDGAQYMQFFDKVSIVVNQAPPKSGVDSAKVIEHE